MKKILLSLAILFSLPLVALETEEFIAKLKTGNLGQQNKAFLYETASIQ
jgi:hypothetical protein